VESGGRGVTFDFGGRPVRPIRRNTGGGSDSGNGGGGGGNGVPPRLPNFGGVRGGRVGIPRWAVLIGVLALLFTLVTATAGFWVDVWWFESLGFVDVLLTRYTALALSFLVGFAVALAFIGANLALAVRAEGGRPIVFGGASLDRRVVTVVLAAGALAFAAFFGLATAAEWESFLRFLNQSAFGVRDPQFGQDVGFYVFTLPVLDFWRGWIVSLIIAVAIAVGLIYLGKFGTEAVSGQVRIPPALRAHASILGAVFLAVTAFGYWLDTRELVYSTRSRAFVGAGYTDVNAQLPANYILLGITALAAVILLANIAARRLPLFLGALGVWGVAALLIGGAYPAAVQNFTVVPNEREREAAFIERNIAGTRAAYNLAQVETVPFANVGDPTRADIAANRASVDNVRLWDYRPLLPSFSQLQGIRQYFQFVDVDVDRYRIDGQYRQVMISARELDTRRLAPQSQTWQNQHLVYTHGYGAVVSNANQIIGEGTPAFVLSNIPPTGPSNLRIAEPRIYYGESPSTTYALVNTRQREFDPTADVPGVSGNAVGYTATGVPLGNVLQKLIFATYLGESRLLLSGDLTPDSQILFRRTIAERLRNTAPFLRYDDDPYLAIVEGQLVWIVDAYTTTNRYPYSQPTSGTIGGSRERFNYIRNSVKATVNAYDGDVRLYIADAEDPIIRTYRNIYPRLFSPISEASPALRERFRYPEELFDVQTLIYARYHVTNPLAFYGGEDLWDIALEQSGTDGGATGRAGLQSPAPQRIESYYVLLRLPGQTTEEFALVRPFTPGGGAVGTNRQNMVAYMVARSDGENYGKLVTYEFPRQVTIQGPLQVQARINQEPDISREITLLNQSGSRVNLGNFLIVPLGNTILYVEPLYVQAENGPFPQLKRVIVASQSRVVMRPTLEEALNALLANEPTVTTPISAAPAMTGGMTAAPMPIAGDTQALTRDALATYQRGQEALRRNDFTVYGMEQMRLEAILRQLNGQPPASSPVASPAAALPTARP